MYFKEFNDTSLNTVRLYCYRSVTDNSINPLHAYIRFGKHGSLVDSSSQGGRTIGVSMEGVLNNFAIGKYGEKYFDLPGVIKYKYSNVPHFITMKNISKEIGSRYHYHRLMGFDFCVDNNDNIRLMEINTLNIGCINQQMNTGPLFGDYTEEIIEYCSTHKKSVILDFYV